MTAEINPPFFYWHSANPRVTACFSGLLPSFASISRSRRSLRMKQLLCALVGLFAISGTKAEAVCAGTIDAVYKYDFMTTFSIRIQTNDGISTNWINMPTKSDEAMALVALTTGKTVVVYWTSSDVTACANGWQHNRVLQGYMVVNK
jgi:hypothetical protein